MIAYSIQAAENSRLLRHSVVSTDDPRIARVARDCGAAVIERPAELARDDTPMVPVVLHALEAAEEAQGLRFDFVMVLQPTCPQRTGRHIDEALDLLVKGGGDSVISVYQVFDHHPARMYRLREGTLVPYNSRERWLNRQALSAVYHRNGAIYAVRREVLTRKKTLQGRDPRPYIMPRELSANIDDALDLELAEILLRKNAR